MYSLGVTRYEHTLLNGIRIVLFHKANSPICTRAMLHAGSCYDPAEYPGLSHLVEHMLVSGSKRFPSKDLLSQHIEQIGGNYMAVTSDDHMYLRFIVPDASDISIVADMIHNTVIDPLIDPQILENEKQVVLKEIGEAETKAERTLYTTTIEQIFAGSPFGHRVLGNVGAVQSVPHSIVLEHFYTITDASRVTIVVSGDITIEQLVSVFSPLPFRTNRPFILPEPTRIPTEQMQQIYRASMDISSVYFAYGMRSVPIFSFENQCAKLLMDMLVHGRTSRLTRSLRYEQGLVYALSATDAGHHHYPLFSITGSTSREKVTTALSSIKSEFAKLRTYGITEQELEFVKNKKLKSQIIKMETSTDWVDFHTYGELMAPNDYYSYDRFVDAISGINTTNIKQIIDDYLTPDNWVITLAGKDTENIALDL